MPLCFYKPDALPLPNQPYQSTKGKCKCHSSCNITTDSR